MNTVADCEWLLAVHSLAAALHVVYYLARPLFSF